MQSKGRFDSVRGQCIPLLPSEHDVCGVDANMMCVIIQPPPPAPAGSQLPHTTIPKEEEPDAFEIRRVEPPENEEVELALAAAAAAAAA